MPILTLIAGLLIFSIGFALGFFTCVLGLITTKAREEDRKTTNKKEDTKK